MAPRVRVGIEVREMMKTQMKWLPLMSAMLIAGALLGGCGASLIENTDVEDTSANRDVLKYVEGYRHAVESRDIGTLISMASPNYFDTNGTVTADDDVDYKGLRAKLNAWKEGLVSARYEIRYRRVQFLRDRVFVDYTYTGNFRVKTADGERAVRRLDDNRIVLERHGDSFKVLSGM